MHEPRLRIVTRACNFLFGGLARLLLRRVAVVVVANCVSKLNC